jgi:hypothetical protein
VIVIEISFHIHLTIKHESRKLIFNPTDLLLLQIRRFAIERNFASLESDDRLVPLASMQLAIRDEASRRVLVVDDVDLLEAQLDDAAPREHGAGRIARGLAVCIHGRDHDAAVGVLDGRKPRLRETHAGFVGAPVVGHGDRGVLAARAWNQADSQDWFAGRVVAPVQDGDEAVVLHHHHSWTSILGTCKEGFADGFGDWVWSVAATSGEAVRDGKLDIDFR